MQNIFINCPFHSSYKPLLDVIIFCSVYAGLEPLISETKDSSEEIITTIKRLIADAEYSVHDISEIQLSEGLFPWFNMPFLLGLDIGCKTYGTKKQQQKRILILEEESFRHKITLSDLAGNDIEYHQNDVKMLFTKLRKWFYKLGIEIEVGNDMHDKYVSFLFYFVEIISKKNYSQLDMEQISKSEFIKFCKDWCIHKKQLIKNE